MTIHQDLARAAPPSDTVITIGTFDGVHLGHQHLIRQLIQAAQRAGLMSLVLTFRNHPRSVLDPSAPMDYITDLETRVALLEGLGIDRVVCIDFTHELSLMRASDFVTTLAKGLRMRGLVVGPDFALGHGREGDIPALERLGKELGFWIEVVEPFAVEEGIIKSRTIRSMLGQGQMDAVQRMLGRSFLPVGPGSDRRSAGEGPGISYGQSLSWLPPFPSEEWHLCYVGAGGREEVSIGDQHRCAPHLRP